MSATVALPPEVAAYLDQVRAALADLPAEERDEMLADVEVSLLEGAADGPPEARLGPPERFAQELRSAAGITTPAPARETGLRDRLRARLATERARSVRATARELAPVWWVVRGYVAACLVAMLAGFSWSVRHPFIPVEQAPAFGLFLILAGIVASVWLGLRTRRSAWHGRWLIAANVVLALLTLPIARQALEGREGIIENPYYETVAPIAQGLALNGEPVQNVYPYSRDGELLLDVLLYDSQGRPLEVGSRDAVQDPLRRYLFTRQGKPLLNAFPIRYVEPGTSRVKRPLAAPEEIEVPKIETPPLKVKRP